MSSHRSMVFCLLILTVTASGRIVRADSPTRLIAWEFNQATRWAGWSPNTGIRDAEFSEAGVAFLSGGNDPQVLSPLFELPETTNTQWIEIDLDCDAAGWGELFYTNTTTGRYSGLDQRWMTWVTVPSRPEPASGST